MLVVLTTVDHSAFVHDYFSIIDCFFVALANFSASFSLICFCARQSPTKQQHDLRQLRLLTQDPSASIAHVVLLNPSKKEYSIGRQQESVDM